MTPDLIARLREVGVQLWNGDCLERMRDIADASVDLVLCDLPYGTTKAPWDAVIPFSPLWDAYERVLKTTGAVVLTAAQPFTSAVVMSNPKWFRYDLVWEKSKATGFLNAKRQPLRAHESILVFSPKAPPYFPQMEEGAAYDKGVRKQQTDGDVYGKFERRRISSGGQRYPRSVKRFTTAEREGGFHKSQKPLALMEWLIKTYSQPGSIVLDNAMGSGTTGHACLNLDRKFIGIDSDAHFCSVAAKRLFSAAFRAAFPGEG